MTQQQSYAVQTAINEPILDPQKRNSSKKTLAIISILGTLVEYFDYSLYGYMAIPLSQYFFPTQDTTVALFQAFGVFAVGSLAKPLGAIIFGRIGDYRGRSTALRYSFLGISIPTLIVGCLPGYETLGAWALLILMICRLAQGIFVSGESDGVRIYLQEHFPEKNHALVSNLSHSGAYLGITLASMMAALVGTTEWWRLPFFISGFSGFLIVFLRHYLVETPDFLKIQEYRAYVPSRYAYFTNWKGIVRTVMVCGAAGGCYHLYLVFWGSFQAKVLGLVTVDQAASRASIMAFVYTLSLPLIGWVADQVGLYRVVRIGAVLALIMTVVNVLTFTATGTPTAVLLLTVLSMSIFSAPCFVLLTRQFDPAVRYRCLSIGHAMGSMLFSGITPAFNILLWQYFHWEYTPLVYYGCLLTMGWGGMMWLRRDQ